MVDAFCEIKNIMPWIFDFPRWPFFCIVFVKEHLAIPKHPIAIGQHEKRRKLERFEGTFIKSIII